MENINTWLEDLGIYRDTMIDSMSIIQERTPNVAWRMDSDVWQLPILVAEVNTVKLHITIDIGDYSMAIVNFEKENQYRVSRISIYDIKNVIDQIIRNEFIIEYEFDLPF